MKIYVGNLSREVTDEDLRKAFNSFGKLESATVIKDVYTGESRGFGFVEMPSLPEAISAINGMNGKELKGRTLNVSEARPREERRGTRPGPVFNLEFLSKLPVDPFLAGRLIVSELLTLYEQDQNKIENHDLYIEALGLFQAFGDRYGIEFAYPEVTSDKELNLEQIISFFQSLNNDYEKEFALSILNNSRSKYSTIFGGKFLYEFTDGDLKKIQEYIDRLRTLIQESTLFSEDHRNRLLMRLEKLQAEIHKKMTNLDRFWAFVGEAGIVLGKFGEDAKPFLDLMDSILKIVWATQSRSEELPSNVPLPQLKSGD